MVCLFVLLSCLDFTVIGSNHILSSYSFTRLNMSLGPDGMGFVGCLDIFISVHLDLVLLDLFVLLSCLDFTERGYDHVLSSCPSTCLDVFEGPDEMDFGGCLGVFIFFHLDMALIGPSKLCLGGFPDGNPLAGGGAEIDTSIRARRHHYWRLLWLRGRHPFGMPSRPF